MRLRIFVQEMHDEREFKFYQVSPLEDICNIYFGSFSAPNVHSLNLP